MKKFFSLLIICFTALDTFSQKTELIVQTGHPGNVNSVDVSPGLQFIATACDDGMVRLFDIKSGFQLHSMRGHTKDVLSVRFSNDGKYIVSSGGDEHILWETATGKKIMTVASEEQGRTCSLISPDQKYFYGDWEEGSIIQIAFADMFHTDNESAVREDSSISFDSNIKRKIFTGHTGPVSCLAVSHNSKFLISSAEDSTIIIWDAATGAILNKIKTSEPVTSIAVSASDKEFLTTSDDLNKSGITFYNITTGKKTRFIADKNDESRSVVCTADGKYFAAGFLREGIKLFDYNTGNIVRTFSGHTSWINSIAIDSSSNYMVSGSHDNMVKLWNLQQQGALSTIQKNIQEINRVSFGDDHKLIAFETEDDKYNYRIRIWDLEKGNGFSKIFTVPQLFNLGYSLKIDNTEKMLMANGDSGIYVWDPVTGKLLDRINKSTGRVAMNDGRIIYGDLKKKILQMYDIKTKKTSILDSLRDIVISSIDFTSDGKLMATAAIGAKTQIWDLQTKKLIRTLDYTNPDGTNEVVENPMFKFEDFAWVYDAKFSPDNKILAAACRVADPIVKGTNLFLWDVKTGKYLKSVVAGNFPVQSINWSPDGKKIITGSNGRDLVIWNVAKILTDTKNEAEPDTIIENGFTVMSAEYTKDGKWLITGGLDGKLIIREAATNNIIATVVIIDSVDYVITTPDNYYAASKNAARAIAFKQGNKVFPFQQFDLQYNRPDIILERLGMASPDMIKAYKNAYQKRLKKVGFSEEMFNKDFHLPEIKLNGNKLPLTTAAKEFSFQVQADDSKYKLDRLEIVDNGVPIYGIAGLSVRDKNLSSITKDINMDLVPGKNKIEVSALNDKGVESLRETFYISYNPATPQPSKIYFIGIGINRYKDSIMNLKYAAKDIRDLAKIFAAKYPGASIDTFINEAATKENILAIKQKLLKTNSNDKIVISASGHGLLDKKLDFYYATNDMDFHDPSVKGLLYDDLENLLDAIPARKKLLLIDACHSGEVDREEKITLRDSLSVNVKAYKARGAGEDESTAGIGLQNTFELMKELFADISKGNGAVVISAAGGFEYALEDAKYNNGVFTYSIKKAMENAKPLTVYQIKDFVSQQVEKLTNGKQKPTSRKENAEFDWSF